MKGRALVAQHGEIAFEDLFTGDSPSIGAASYIAGPLAFLLTNDYEPVEIDAARPDDRLVGVAAHGGARARVGRYAGGAARPHGAGEDAASATYRGDEVTHTVPVEMPVNATGAADAAGRRRRRGWPSGNSARRGSRQQAHGVAQMVQGLQQGAQEQPPLRAPAQPDEPAPSSSGEPLAALPPSVLAVLDGDRSGGRSFRCAAPRSASGTSPRITPSAAPRYLSLDGTLTRPRPRPASPPYPSMPRRFRLARGRSSPRCLCRGVSRAGAGARFWEVATQTDFLKGDVDEPVDRLARPAAARPGADTRSPIPQAPVLWAAASRAATAPSIVGSRQRRPGAEGRAGRRRAGVLRCERARGARAGARAGRRPLRRHVARRARSTESTHGQAAPFFDPEDKYIWALAADAGRRALRGDRRQGRHLPHHARRQGQPFLQDEVDARAHACCSWPRATCSLAPNRPGRSSASEGRQRLPVLDSSLQEISALTRRRPTASVYAAALTRKGRRTSGRRSRRPCRRRQRQPPCRRCPPRSRPSRSSTSRRRRAGSGASRLRARVSGRGRVYRILPDGVLGSGVVVRRRRAVRRDASTRRQPAGGNRRQGQDLSCQPASRRETTLVARARAQQVTGVLPRARGATARRDRESRARCSASAAAAATSGTLRVGRPRRRDRRHLGRHQLARRRPSGGDVRLLHALGQHGSARRDVEPMVVRIPQGRGRTDHQPEGALHAVED